MPLLMRTRNEAAVYFEQRIAAAAALDMVAAWNRGHPERRISFFHLVVWSIVQTFVERPRLNRFTSGGRLYQRRGIWVSFSAKTALDDASPIFVVKRELDPAASFAALVDRLHGGVDEGRSGKPTKTDRELKLLTRLPLFLLSFVVWFARRLDAWNLLPHWFIRDDPMYASLFVANLGSLKLDA